MVASQLELLGLSGGGLLARCERVRCHIKSCARVADARAALDVAADAFTSRAQASTAQSEQLQLARHHAAELRRQLVNLEGEIASFARSAEEADRLHGEAKREY